jgi:RND family efflux transporter MFP subunit
MPKSPERSARRLFPGGTVLIAVGLLAACRTTSTAPPAETKSTPPTVAVAAAARTDMARKIVLTGEFRPLQEIEVMAKVAGYVKKINVDVGDRVQAGQLLATLEIPEMADDLERGRAALDKSQSEVAHAQDGLRLAESSHEMAHLTYTRLRDVAKEKPGLVALEEVDIAHGKDLVAEAQVNAARSVLATAEKQIAVGKAELRRTQTMNDYTRVTAPFAGVITRRFVDNGSMVQAGTASSTQAMPVVRLSDGSTLRLVLPVPESAVPNVRIGQEISARVPTLKRIVKGRVARFTDKVALATRTMDTEVDVPNPGLTLLPGMYAEVDLTLESRPGALAVPAQAIDLAGSETSGVVLVVGADGKIESRPVQLGLQTATDVEILSGVSEGDRVIIGSRAGLKAGQIVQGKLTQTGAKK